MIGAVTNLCDMACIHCSHPVIKKAPGDRGAFMDPALHTRLVEETRRFKDQLWVFRYAADGESMLHPKFLDMVEQTKRPGTGGRDRPQPGRDGAAGLDVVRVLEAAHQSIQKSGGRIRLV